MMYEVRHGQRIASFKRREDAVKKRDELRARCSSEFYAKRVRLVRVRTAADLREERLALRAALVKARKLFDVIADRWPGRLVPGEQANVVAEIDAALARRR